MKYAVDINLKKNSITGWASTDANENIDNCMVSIFRNDNLLHTCALIMQRDDVLKAGLHPDGKCGFVFSNENINLICGSIYKVQFKDSNGKIILSKQVFYGEVKEFIDQFNTFELPRDDFSIMNDGPEELFRSGNDFLAFKKLLIRLRRGKRAHGWRGAFSGHDYPCIHRDWIFFREFVESNIDILLLNMRPRYLCSIVDVFADYAEVGERMAALAISNILMHERFSQTLKCVYDFSEKYEKILDRQLHYWGGMATNRLDLDDAFDVFMTRNIECLEYFPLMKKFFGKFMKEMLIEDSSILNVNLKNSKFFSEAANFYRNSI